LETCPSITFIEQIKKLFAFFKVYPTSNIRKNLIDFYALAQTKSFKRFLLPC